MLVRLGGVVALVMLVVGGLTACSDDSSTASSLPVPTADDLAGAQVSGQWVVTLTIDAQTPPALDNSVKQGDTLTREYVLTGGCNTPDTVDCTVQRESGAGQSEETWTRQGATLSYQAGAPVTLSCQIDGADTPVDYHARATFTLEVTDAIEVGDQWIATELGYAREAEMVPTGTAASQGCPTGTQTESGTGVPAESSGTTTVAPTTAASPTTGP